MGHADRANPRNLQLSRLSADDRRRALAVEKAANALRADLHDMLDAHLNEILPELLAQVSVGMGVTVGIRTLPPPTADDLDPNAEAILSQDTGLVDAQGEAVRRLGLEPKTS